MSKTVYLAGGMEFTEDGKSWRDKTVAVLKEKGIASWDPYEEEAKIFEAHVQPSDLIKTLDKVDDFDSLTTMMKQVVCLDLGVVHNEVDALIVKYDLSVLKGAGTHAEMSMATYAGKPVHVWMRDPVELYDIPTWIMGCITTMSWDYDEVINNIMEGM